MTKEEFEALEIKIKKTTVPTNYMKLMISYSTELVLTYEKGIAFLASLTAAESITTKGIVPVGEYTIRSEVMSQQMYIDYKMANLLNLSYKEIVEMKKELEVT